MAKPENDKPCESEHIDSTLDTVLISALREHFEIKSGHHVDRNEILEFLRSVIKDHPELNFVLQHRDTKLSSRIYKAFPKVTTKRVAVPNIRGKKTWTYTNLKRITNPKGSQLKQHAHVTPQKTQITRSSKTEPKGTSDATEPLITPSSKRERRHFRSKRSVQSASMVQRDSLFETYKRERENSQKSSRHAGNVPQQSYLGRFNDMLKWVKEHYILDANSSIQVKHIVENIKEEFKINITYKQSHKLIFAVFPGQTSRVEHPVKIEAQGGFYSYQGIAPKPKQGREELEEPFAAEPNHSPCKPNEPQNVRKSMSTRQTWIPPDNLSENGRKRIFRTRKRFIEACAVLKPAEEALVTRARYDLPPIPSEILPVVSEVPSRFSDVSSKISDVSPRFADVSPRFSNDSTKISEGSPSCSEVSPRFSNISPRNSESSPRLPNFSPRLSDVPPRFYELPPMVSEEFRRCENNWQRIYEELKQERDQAIVERNQAMVSLMEIEREQTTQTPEDLSRRQTTAPDVPPSIRRIRPKSEGRENPDWLGSLISRSNSILGEQMSEANAVYFPGSALQNSNCNQRYPKQAGYPTGDYMEIERYEQLKQERDTIWKNWIDKLTAEKDDLIQQLKLDKMEVIQHMELEKSDAVECIEEKLTNQITILTREMRELKELLNHTMNERTLAIGHAHKLVELVGEEQLKEAGLENFPFDATKDHIVHPPKLKAPDETATQKALVCSGKGNKRKQSMPAKLKKIPRLDSSMSTESDKHADNIPRNSSQSVSTESKNLLPDTESTNLDTDSYDNVTIDNGPVDNGLIDEIDDASTDTIDNGATDQSIMVSDSERVLSETQNAYSIPSKNFLTASAAESRTTSFSAENQTIDSGTGSTEISKKLESPVTEDSNMDISEKSDNTFVTSHPKNIPDSTVNTVSTNSGNQIENQRTVNSDISSDSEKTPPEISRTVNTSAVLGNCSNAGNVDTSLKLPSTTTNLAEILTRTSTTDSGTLKSHSESFSANSQQIPLTSTDNNNSLGKLEYLVPLNAQKYFSETSGKYSPYTSGKYMSELSQTGNSNFQKYVSEIPKNAPTLSLNTELQKLNPGIPRTISTCTDSEFPSQEGPKSFEESVNSTFLKYFPEIPKRSFNSPFSAESGAYFRDIPRTVCSSVNSDSGKFIQDSGNQALVYPDEKNFPEQKKVSSIDFLSSMVENIGKSSVE